MNNSEGGRLRVRQDKPKKIQILLDFDDTIFPTTSYTNSKMKLEKLNTGRPSLGDCFDELKKNLLEEKVSLQDYDEKLHKFLKMLMKIGNVSIVTLSDKGWPLVSCGGLFDKSSSLMASIPIVHALEFRQDTRDNMEILKYKAMRSCLEKDIELLVSIGDSVCEANSAWRLKNESLVPRVLTVKLSDRPSGFELLESLKLLYILLPHMMTMSRHKDYEVIYTLKTEDSTFCLASHREAQLGRRCLPLSFSKTDQTTKIVEDSLRYVLNDDFGNIPSDK